MKKFTQKELLNEGFWDSFPARVLKGAAVVGKFATKTLAPEIYNPISSVVSGIKDLNQQLIKATTPEASYIINKLANQGYSIVGDIGKIKMRQGDDKQLYKVSVVIRQNFISSGEPNPQKIFLVDKDGNIVRDLSAKNAAKGGKKPQKQRVSPVVTNPQTKKVPPKP
jgi:hypothetical protein